MTVAIVDCGGENLRSVQRAVEIHKIKAVITNDKAKVSNASFVILPGVGSAQNVMQTLESKNLIETIKSLTQPVLGICIGMHVLFNRSDEQDTECMKIISGNVKKFNSDRRFKVPQMGWNKVTFLKEQTKDLDDYYYFANSYYSQIINQTIATAEHSVPFTAAIQKNNFLGCQFHPEKSSLAGRKFLEYFFNKL